MVQLPIETSDDGKRRWMSLHFIRNFSLSLQKEITENYNQIQFKPTEFVSYLLSTEVGFETCTTIAVPDHAQKGRVQVWRWAC